MPQTKDAAAERSRAGQKQRTFTCNRAWTILILAVLSWLAVFGLLKLIGII